ncbi:kinesin light chain 1 [Nemania sp. FL0031]|nr:kinesin light chain 1 [Nemania sp. FL0031]
MRLLKLQTNGQVCLTKDIRDDMVPPYAILSHTWGADDQEIIFQDINDNVGKQKNGYRKIKFCAQQALSDGLTHFWVDTCCIDKSNSTELSEAINSMFRWYQNATKCYVFLSDVHVDSLHLDFGAAFRCCRWFTRGWTLQELIAPSSVEFFSCHGQRIGDKKSLSGLLHEATGIPVRALQMASLSEFSVHERVAWMRGRNTTRPEDRVYSLLGILNVYMPLIYGEGEQHAFIRLQEEINKRPDTHWNFPYDRVFNFVVPFGRKEDFVGREAIITRLLEKLPPLVQKDDCQRIVIEGLGGVGKTQIALEAAYRLRDRFPGCAIFWVPLVNRAMFENAYRDIGRVLGIQRIDESKADIKALVKARLSHDYAGSWILIIDNADDVDLLFGNTNGPPLHDFIPFSRRGSILFTTRNHEVTTRLDTQPSNTFWLHEMGHAEATDMLQKCLGRDHLHDAEGAKRLLDFLAYLPLAIKQASSYIIRTGITLSRYLELCQSSSKVQARLLSQGFHDRGRYGGVANPVATTWLVSFTHIARDYPLAAQYLKFSSFLAEKDIPMELLPTGEDPLAEIEAIGILKAYAFILQREKPDRFDMHRLVRLAMRNWLREQNQHEVQLTEVVQLVSQKFPSPQYENRELWTGFLPHAQAVLEFEDGRIDIEARCSLLQTVGESYRLLGKYNEGAKLYRQTLELRRKNLGRLHPSTLATINNLAKILILDSQGNYEEAKCLLQQVLEMREHVLGKMHADTLTSMNNLALVFHGQRRYCDAEDLYWKTLGLKEKVLGQEHPDNLRTMNNLAVALYSQKKFGEAEKIYQQTLTIKIKVLGQDHPLTLISFNNLALALGEQGRHKEAERIHRQHLRVAERVLGQEHLGTLDSMGNLGVALFAQEKFQEAEKALTEEMTLKVKVLGYDHPSTLKSIKNLAGALKIQGKHEEARRVGAKATANM